jgi:uncharacterized protein (TIGR00369 family)
MDETTSSRRRIVEWQDPLTGLEGARALSGIDYLRAMKSGDLPAPPVTQLVGFSLDVIESGRVVFDFVPGEVHYNPIGSVHGGILSVVLDSAMGCAVQSKLPMGALYTTLEFKVNFVRPVTAATGKLACEGRVIHTGTKTATAEGYLRDASGRLYAHSTTTCLLLG